jgi:alpha-glucosidase
LIVVGELADPHTLKQAADYVNPANHELQTVFHQHLKQLDRLQNSSEPFTWRPWKVQELGALLERWQTLKRDEGFWNSVFLENHDNARSVSRFGNTSSPELRALSAKLLAILQITQSGTLYVYQGEELGMANFSKSWGIEEYKDSRTQDYYASVKKKRQNEQGKEDVDMSDVMERLNKKARDQGRTPVQVSLSFRLFGPLSSVIDVVVKREAWRLYHGHSMDARQ